MTIKKQKEPMYTIKLWNNNKKEWFVHKVYDKDNDVELKNRNIVIGYGVRIGYNVRIADGVEIGEGVRIGNGVVIGDNVRIGIYVKIEDDAKVFSNKYSNNTFVQSIKEQPKPKEIEKKEIKKEEIKKELKQKKDVNRFSVLEME